MSQLDVANAKKALSVRLMMWSVEEPAKKADGFIEDLVSQGWVMSPKHESRPQPPRRDQQCGTHSGQWADRCAGCRVDELADDEQPPVPAKPTPASGSAAAANAIREQLRKAKA